MARVFRLEIETGNDAFADDEEAEVARILRRTADYVESHLSPGSSLRDTNGNKVGRFAWDDEPDETMTVDEMLGGLGSQFRTGR